MRPVRRIAHFHQAPEDPGGKDQDFLELFSRNAGMAALIYNSGKSSCGILRVEAR
jgi:hypothetical protein